MQPLQENHRLLSKHVAMRKLFYLPFLFCYAVLHAQVPVLYGIASTSSTGGIWGAIYKIDGSGANYSTPFLFNSTAAYGSYSDLVQTPDGKIYGLTNGGGPNQCGNGTCGVLYNYDIPGNTFTTLMNFNMTQGYHHQGLIASMANTLYGLDGVGIFRFDPSTGSYTGLNAGYGNMIMQASNGLIYGVEPQNGANNYGYIYVFDTLLGTSTILHSFNGLDGKTPLGTLVEAPGGLLYGTTLGGGNNNNGVIFSFDPITSTFTKLYDLDQPGNGDGSSPVAQLLYMNSKLYGTTRDSGAFNGGVLFCYDVALNTYTKLQDFNFINGASPRSPLLLASDGNIYGSTFAGGISNMGTLFRYIPATNTFSNIHNFTGGAYAPQGLIEPVQQKTIIKENEEPGSVLYPNPSSGKVNLKYGKSTGPCQVTIFNSLGLPVKSITTGSTTELVNTGELPEGVYFVRVALPGGQIQSLKMILENNAK